MRQFAGYFTTKQLQEQGLSRYRIKNLCKQDILLRIKKGLYRNIDMFYQDQNFLDVCQAIPTAVITSYSALFYYGLSTHIPTKVFVCIPYNGRVNKVIYPPTVQYRKDNTHFKDNIITEQRDKFFFRIYDMEKTVCDVVKNRKTMGMDTVKEVLREYLKKKNKDMLKLYTVAKKDKVFDILNEFLTIMR